MLDKNIVDYFSTQTLLIVEDHYQTRELLRSMLEIFFENILLATDGIECLEQVKSKKVDLLITDIKMPSKSGIECIEKIRSEDYKLPVIVISAFSDDEYLLKAANLNIQGYLIKPLDLEELENTLEKIFYLNHPHQALEIANDFQFDYANSTIQYQDQKISLTKKENDFFQMLCDNRDKIVTYSELEYGLWEKNNESMTINSLRTLVKKLRSKLPVNVIKNISKTGYKLDIESL